MNNLKSDPTTRRTNSSAKGKEKATHKKLQRVRCGLGGKWILAVWCQEVARVEEKGKKEAIASGILHGKINPHNCL